MNTFHTRLHPGSPWVHSSADVRATEGSAGSRRPRAIARPSVPPMPAVEVNELRGDTLFDRFFGHPPSAAPSPG